MEASPERRMSRRVSTMELPPTGSNRRLSIHPEAMQSFVQKGYRVKGLQLDIYACTDSSGAMFHPVLSKFTKMGNIKYMPKELNPWLSQSTYEKAFGKLNSFIKESTEDMNVPNVVSKGRRNSQMALFSPKLMREMKKYQDRLPRRVASYFDSWERKGIKVKMVTGEPAGRYNPNPIPNIIRCN